MPPIASSSGNDYGLSSFRNFRLLGSPIARLPPLYTPPKPIILCFSQQPRIFDLRRRASAAEHADDFSGGVGLAVDVGFVGVGRGVTGDNDVGQHDGLNLTPQSQSG